jgi:hypothetical protein
VGGWVLCFILRITPTHTHPPPTLKIVSQIFDT